MDMISGRLLYLMTGFDLLQDFVVANLFHVVELLDLSRAENHNEKVDGLIHEATFDLRSQDSLMNFPDPAGHFILQHQLNVQPDLHRPHRPRPSITNVVKSQ